jgi:hypothetical protein
MAQIDTIEAARPLHGAMMHGKRHRIALPERHHLGPRLHSRPLLGQHELAAFEIRPGSDNRIATCSGNTCSP